MRSIFLYFLISRRLVRDILYSFKDGFKRARKEANYTQETFCDNFINYDGIKVSLSTVRNWEQGRNIPELKTIEALCGFFHCDMDYLFFNIECKNHDTQFIHEELGLSEISIERLRHYKKQYPDYIGSMNFLLESDNFENVLYHIYEYSNSLRHLNLLHNMKRKQLASLATIQDYKPNLSLLEAISTGIDKMDLSEYKLSTHFGFIIQEIKRKLDAEQ